LSLQGSNPKDAKAPEGDVWVDPTAAKTVAVADPNTAVSEPKKP
jgi:cytochrome c oxidase cbb3-type subunit 3